MRLIKISSPGGTGSEVLRIAFETGIERAALHHTEDHLRDGTSEARDIIDIQTSTPKGKRFVDALVSARFYDPERYTISMRSPLSVVSRESLPDLTIPVTETGINILEELYQFSHVTYSFVGRVFIAASLLSYGMIRQQLLLMIAGLLFLPLLPLLQAIGFGAWTRHWRLLAQGAFAFLLAVALMLLAGALVAFATGPPLRFDDFAAPLTGFVISVAVGTASGLALIDDAGKREMIGLAASAQIALVPVWFGISAVLGFSDASGESKISVRAGSFAVNVVTLILASLAVHVVTRTAHGGLKKLDRT